MHIWQRPCLYKCDGGQVKAKRVLVVKFCVQVLHSCGLNNLVAVPTTLRSV